MSPEPAGDVTVLLKAWAGGDGAALERLVPIVLGQLRRMARHYMRGEAAGHTLQATALVNEAYVRMLGTDGVSWQDRAHFFAVSAQMMRRILVDAARARGVVEMKFFCGLSVEDTAAVLKISPRSVMRDWNLARAWLMRELAS